VCDVAHAAPAIETPPAEPSTERDVEPDRRLASAAITAGAYSLLFGWVTLAWYVRAEDAPQFQVHDEGWFGADTYAGGADKLGHFWGNYAMTRGVSQTLQWGGWKRGWSIAAAGGLSLAFFTFSEIKDGYKVAYGFSYGDMIANTLGAGLGVAFELSPALDRRFDVRLSYLPSASYIDRLSEDGPFNTPEDYTGQTFFVDYHLGSIDAVRRHAPWARYLDLSVGYRAVNYKPMPMNGEDRRQELFVGASLNVQAVLAHLSKHGVVNFIGEMYQVPYTTLPLAGVERQGGNTASMNTGQ